MLGRTVFVCSGFWIALAALSLGAGIGHDPPVTSVDLSERGGRLFRAARFEEAEAAYLQAIDLDRTNIRGQLGVARIAAMMSDKRRAARYYSAAYQLNPRDPEAILGYANSVEDNRARRTLLENFLVVAKDARAEDVKARIGIADRLGAEIGAAENSQRRFRIALEIDTANGPTLRARLNQGRELRLLVDTGASGITLNATTASKLNLEDLTAAAITGFGSAAPAPARMMRAESFESGGLRISNVPIEVAESDLLPGADGVIGPDLFRDFRIRLNFRGHSLTLTPCDEPGADLRRDESARALRLDHLLLIPATVDGHAKGYFIVDSGASSSLVARTLLFDDGIATEFAGAQGGQKVFRHSHPLTIRLGDRSLAETSWATFDNSEISARYGTEISGVIGYSLLHDFALVLDYRTGVVKFEKP